MDVPPSIGSFTAKAYSIRLVLLLCVAASAYGLADAMFVAGRSSSAVEYSFPVDIFVLFGGCFAAIMVGRILVLKGNVALGVSAMTLAAMIEGFFWLGMHG